MDFRNVRARLIETTERLLSVEQELA